jgi:hypothetical protein
LSSLLIVIAIISVALGWYTVNARRYRAELSVIENLKVAPYGYVAVLHEDETLFCGTGVGGIARMRWHGPSWLRTPLEWWGRPILYRTAELELWSLAPDEIEQFARLRHLSRIEVYGASISEDCRARLRDMLPQVTIEVSFTAEAEDADDPFS